MYNTSCIKRLSILVFLVLAWSCEKEKVSENEEMKTDSSKPNILLIIADDMGKDATAGFPEGSTKPNTPNLDQLQSEGLSFSNLWVNPTCSPTRASIITGKYGYRTGVKWAADELNSAETVLQKYINEQTNDAYATALIGKWHLSGARSTANPESFGIDYYAGLLRGTAQDYYQWQLTEDGNGSSQTEYITKVFTDLSIEWINNQSKPWFLWLAYTAPHTPFHVPPSEMHSQGVLPSYTDNLEPLPYYIAAIEAMDYQIGALLEGISEDELENTVIIFVGDNGTPIQVAQSPYSRNTAKGSIYQGGVNVPMFIAGKDVGRTGMDDNLITGTDLFSTIAEIAGVNSTSIHDSKSIKSLLNSPATHRSYQYTEMDDGIDDLWAINNGTFKLIVRIDGSKELYNIVNDPYESTDLLKGTLDSNQASAKAELEAELAVIRS